MKSIHWISTVATAGAVIMAAANPVLAQNNGMAGRWALDPERSDMREDAETGGGIGERRPVSNTRGGVRPGGRRGGADTRMSQQDRERVMTIMRRAMRPARALSITMDDSTVTIRRGAQDPVTYLADGDRHEMVFPDGYTARIKAEWKGDKLQIETRADGGLRITEEFELKEDGADLEVKIRIENPRANMRSNLKRVYISG